MKPLSVLALTVAGTLAQVTLALAPGTSASSLAQPFRLEIADAASSLGSPAVDTRDTAAIPLVTRILEQSPDRRATSESSVVRLDPADLSRQTELDARAGLAGTDLPFAHTLGYNTTATPTSAGYSSMPIGHLKAAHASTDNPAMRELLAAVITLQSAGTSAAAITTQLADRNGFLHDAALPSTLGRDPGWVLQALPTESGSATFRGDPVTSPAAESSGKSVDLAALAHLDFFLLARATQVEASAVSAQLSQNPEGAAQVVSLAYTLGNSPYLLLGFEHLYGSQDKRAENELFAVNIGAAQVAALTATPEPATWMTLGVCTAMGLWWRRKAAPTPRAVVAS